MGIKATPGQRDILGDIIDLFTPKLAIEIRRYKDLGYESSPIDFINLSTTNDKRLRRAHTHYFRRKTIDTLSNLHRWHGERFREEEDPENIYEWIEHASKEYYSPRVTIKIYNSPNSTLHSGDFHEVEKNLSKKENDHLQHLIHDRNEGLKFLSDWQYEDHLPKLDFSLRLYTRQAIILFYGLMKTNHLRIGGNENSHIDLEVFKNFLRQRVALMPKNDISPREPYDLKWNELITPREGELEPYFKELNLSELPEVSQLEENSINRKPFNKRNEPLKTFTTMEKALITFLKSIENAQGKRGRR